MSAGVVAIALARAGADVVAADLPHITPLTRENVSINCGTPLHRCTVSSCLWSRVSRSQGLASSSSRERASL